MFYNTASRCFSATWGLRSRAFLKRSPKASQKCRGLRFSPGTSSSQACLTSTRAHALAHRQPLSGLSGRARCNGDMWSGAARSDYPPGTANHRTGNNGVVVMIPHEING
ncbi:hypothetical protein MHEI_16730 [Mycobacterium heidelbergense]|nr:hypothetical protein MHEI_16730 [Mycobacterium heidelbergense]